MPVKTKKCKCRFTLTFRKIIKVNDSKLVEILIAGIIRKSYGIGKMTLEKGKNEKLRILNRRNYKTAKN